LIQETGWRRRVFAQVLLPGALVACAAGWAYQFVAVAQQLYASH